MAAIRPVLRTASAVLAVALVPALVVPALAATTAVPAAGSAVSEFTLFQLTSGTTSVAAGELRLASSTFGTLSSTLDVVPIDSSVTGKVGEVRVTPADSPQTVGGQSASLPIGGITGPTVNVVASTAGGYPLASATMSGLGRVNLLGIPLTVGTANLVATSTVTRSQALAAKTLTVGKFGLPSIGSLLDAFGLNLGQLTTSQIAGLVAVLGSTVSATTAAAITADNAAVASGQAALGVGAQSLASAQTLSNTAEAAFLSALSPLVAVGDDTLAYWNSLGSVGQTALLALHSGLAAANTTMVEAASLVSAISNLLTDVGTALHANPLAVVNGVRVAVSALASSSPTAGATATIGSVDVLGLASSLSQFAAVVTNLTTTLDSITGVRFVPPAISLGQVAHATARSGGETKAYAWAAGLLVTLPSITVPAALRAVPSRARLSAPRIVSVASPTGTLTIGQIAESAVFQAAVPATVQQAPAVAPKAPTSPGRALPDTGLAVGIPIAAMVLVGCALVVRRWRGSAGH
ncbi:MAG TPA: hypothetical protein VNG13_08835 [Mycobacteriales bacterium]|nr:hypothetical protein [Mycobacteriales bacterium]